MDENEKKEPETAQEPPKPEDYSRYMGTLNRIYRRNNNPQRKKLGDGIASLKKGQQPAAPAPEPGKKRPQLPCCGGRSHRPDGDPVFYQALINKKGRCAAARRSFCIAIRLRRSRSGTSRQPQWQLPRLRPRR